MFAHSDRSLGRCKLKRSRRTRDCFGSLPSRSRRIRTKNSVSQCLYFMKDLCLRLILECDMLKKDRKPTIHLDTANSKQRLATLAAYKMQCILPLCGHLPPESPLPLSTQVSSALHSLSLPALPLQTIHAKTSGSLYLDSTHITHPNHSHGIKSDGRRLCGWATQAKDASPICEKAEGR